MTQTTRDISYEEFEKIVTTVNNYNVALLKVALTGDVNPSAPDLPDWVTGNVTYSADVSGGTESEDYSDLPQSILNVFAQDRDTTKVRLNEHKSALQEIAGKVNDISEDELRSELGEQNKKIIDKISHDLTENTNRLVETAKEEKRKNPNVTFKKVGAAHAKEEGFLQFVWKGVVAIVDQLIDEIKNFFKKIGQWFEDRWNDVKDWFHKTFGL
ncbi:hypothetical protein [Saccharothrix xinjiangensis]|uniref:Type VII secretion system (Wss) protein ESAT-6 n=1 Tax=Saccharothrix xinjiangensis TaxID=204798 RepID=A0ABV9XY89_9PSEU